MDAANTQQIARSVVAGIDFEQDPDRTTELPASLIAANDHSRSDHSPSGHPLSEAQPTTPLVTPATRGHNSSAWNSRPLAPQQQTPAPRTAPAGELNTSASLVGLVGTTDAEHSPTQDQQGTPGQEKSPTESAGTKAAGGKPDELPTNEHHLDGLVPTITQKSGGLSSLARTLEGLD
jgi:hypothetical protein